MSVSAISSTAAQAVLLSNTPKPQAAPAAKAAAAPVSAPVAAAAKDSDGDSDQGRIDVRA